MTILRRTLSRVKRAVVPPRPKEELAALWVINNFSRFSPSEMDDIVRRYWTEYRRFDEILSTLKMSTTDSDLRLLDIGGGYSTGLRLFETPFRWVVDIDIDELYKAGMPMPSDIRFVNGPGERIPFPDSFFNCVFCTNALDHVEDPERVLAETHRVLKPDGNFVLMVDLFDEAAEHPEHDILHPHTLHPETIDDVLGAEFVIEEHTTQPTKGKVGLRMLAHDNVVPHSDRQEHIYLLQPKDGKSGGWPPQDMESRYSSSKAWVQTIQ